MDDIKQKDPEDLRDYIEHLQSARERLLDTYNDVREHSMHIIDHVWQDAVCDRFMEMLDQKQSDLYCITEVFEYNQRIMQSQLEVAEDIAHQDIQHG